MEFIVQIIWLKKNWVDLQIAVIKVQCKRIYTVSNSTGLRYLHNYSEYLRRYSQGNTGATLRKQKHICAGNSKVKGTNSGATAKKQHLYLYMQALV